MIAPVHVHCFSIALIFNLSIQNLIDVCIFENRLAKVILRGDSYIYTKYLSCDLTEIKTKSTNMYVVMSTVEAN